MNMNDGNTNDMNDTNDPNRPLDPNGKDDSIGRENFGCDAFAEALSLFVFGEAAELDDERRAALESHLVSCAACRSERDALMRSLELLKSESLRGAAPQLSAERQAKLMEEARTQATATAASGATAPAAAGARVVSLGRWAIAAGLIAAAGAGWFVWQAQQLALRKEAEVVASRASSDGSAAYLASAPVPDGEDSRRIRVDNHARPFVPPTGDPAAAPADLSAPLVPTQSPSEPTALSLPSPAPLRDERAAEHAEAVLRSMTLEEKDALTETEDLLDLSKVETGRVEPPAKPAGALGPETGEPPVSARGGDSKTASGGASAPSAPTVNVAKKGAQAGRQRGIRGSAPAQPESNPGIPRPLSSTGGTSAAMPPGTIGWNLPDAFYDTPDIAANTTTTYELARRWASQDSVTWVGGDESNDDATNVLKKLGYIRADAGGGGGDTAGPFPRTPLDPAVVGAILAAACSPSDVIQFQARVAAALGIDPAAPRADVEKDRDTIVREFLDRLSRRQNEPPRDMFFRYFGDHPFVSTRIDCKSTFGMDVDTASYALVRAYLAKGMLPPKAAVRTEEFVNAFKHDLAPPSDDDSREKSSRDVFAIHTEVAPSPFGDDRQLLLHVGLKARTIPKSQRKPVALTFIIDVSGSMAQDGRLELVKQSLHLLVNQLDERDTIGIVSFESKGHRILDPTNAAQRGRIFGALDQLRPEGSTNADEGLRLGYDMALEQWRSSAENRVVLCSDGVANTGVTDPKVLSARIAECKSKYIYLNCVGVGMGNHNDALMEQLADEGDGFCAYLDRIEEAKKIFVERLTGTLMTVARNAKIQVEFDPTSVRCFRQLGYEKRALAHRDFRNDRVDAGEVGAGQEVVALYEIEPKGDAAGPLATVRIRYEDPDKGEVREQARQVFAAEVAPTLAKTTPRFRLSACVAEFAEILRQSVHARDGSFGAVSRLAEPLVDELSGDTDVPEFVALVQQAARLPDLLPRRDEMVRCVDELKRLRWMREEYRDSKNDADEALMRRLEEQNRELERQLRDALDRALRHS